MRAATSEAVSDPLLGKVVAGRYQLDVRLGAGGMGAVYRARHLSTGGVVAVKVLHGDAHDDEVAQKRFTLEAQHSAQLTSPAVVRVIDFGVDGGLFYLVMEHVAGPTLDQVLADGGPLAWPRAVAITRQLLSALVEAHEHPKRIVHRDIKPSNIVFTHPDGEGDTVKLLDFGISRALTSSGAGTAGFIGTPYYAAPEIWKGDAADVRTDLYALGAVLCEMLTGSPPFSPPPSTGNALAALASMHSQSPRPAREAFDRDVPTHVIALVQDLLAVDRASRPASARAALARLDRTGATAPRRLSALLFAAAGIVAVAAVVVVMAVAKPAGPALEQCLPADARTIPNTRHEGYTARLGAADHRGPDGHPLTTAGAIVARDQERAHAGPTDPGEVAFDKLEDPRDRAQLQKALDLTLAETLKQAIVDGTPRVRFDFYLSKADGGPGGFCLTVLD